MPKNFVVCLFLFTLLLSTVSGTTSALSIRVLPGGIPFVDADELFRQGLAQSNSRLLRQAWDEYERAIDMSGPKLDSYLKMGRVFFHLSMIGAVTADDARRIDDITSRARELAPDSVQLHHLHGLALAGKGQYPDAVDELRMAMELRPPSEFLLCDLAAIHVAVHQSARTIALLEGKHLRHGWSFAVLAVAWLQQGQPGKAMMNLLKARRLGMRGNWADQLLQQIRPGLEFPE